MPEAETTGSTDVTKALATMKGGEIGQPGLTTSSSFVNELAKTELKVPSLYKTIDQMLQDPAVSHPMGVSKAFKVNALALGSYESVGGTASDAMAEYANYLIHNMKYQSWFEAVQNLTTDGIYGFSIGELATSRATSGPYAGDLVLDRIGPRAPKSIYGFVWDEYKRGLTHVVQNPIETAEQKLKNPNARYAGNGITLDQYRDLNNFNKYPLLNVNKILHCKYNTTFSNPQGNSPFVPAFNPWQEKRIIEQYQIIGVTRGLGGVPVIRVDDELLKRANDPDGKYPADTAALRALEENAANTHAGKNAFFMLPSSLVDGSTSTYKYDIKLLGVDGNNGSVDISEIVNQKTTSIYNEFAMGHLILGQNGSTSSYNLSTSGQSMSAVIIKRDLINYVGVINSILPRMLDAARIKYSPKDLPKFKWKDDDISLEDLGKFAQRVMSVGAGTEEILREAYKRSPLGGVDLDSLSELDYTGGQSRAGEGNGTSGTGNPAQQNSATNVENKSQAPFEVFRDKQGNLRDFETTEIITDERGEPLQTIGNT